MRVFCPVQLMTGRSPQIHNHNLRQLQNQVMLFYVKHVKHVHICLHFFCFWATHACAVLFLEEKCMTVEALSKRVRVKSADRDRTTRTFYAWYWPLADFHAFTSHFCLFYVGNAVRSFVNRTCHIFESLFQSEYTFMVNFNFSQLTK